ncbi:protein spitz isoform X1 [Rhagoletis pomonella]|uniref:protein spitz isoform X1 n=2 Tax=Rhagoletis pomonella TaxID=28610 RepID=UPI00177D9766|nr:protein spitz isoform X1 [Rhagoletis pomonella]
MEKFSSFTISVSKFVCTSIYRTDSSTKHWLACCQHELHERLSHPSDKSQKTHANWHDNQRALSDTMPERRAAFLHPSDTERLLCIFLALILLAPFAAACSSRAIQKSPPPPLPSTGPADDSTTQRPNITFPIYSCPPTYAAWYCLNEATCFTVEIHNEILYNCECATGFMGPRCEYKEIDGSYLPTRQRAMLETASIASGATLALLVVVILCLMWYIRYDKQRQKLNESAEMAHDNEGLDEVDGMTRLPVRRPFGEHHYKTLPLAAAFKR